MRQASPTILRSAAGVQPAFFRKHSPILGGRRTAGSHVGSSDAKNLVEAARTAHHELYSQRKLCYVDNDDVEALMEKIKETLDGLQKEIKDSEREQRMRELSLHNDTSGENTITDHKQPRPSRQCLRSAGHFSSTTLRLDPFRNQIEHDRTMISFSSDQPHTPPSLPRSFATTVGPPEMLPTMYLDGYPERVFKNYWQVDVEDYTHLLGEQKETLQLKTMQNTSRAVCDAVHAILKATGDSVEF
ncbi:hypothetical protein FN846DRAFT_889783 [Sphaerosporella brunnea]|uniref:Uncharacterized protein n=1 Tax=Sphaerosporella brunnea TaxID=1250544 RepID=A0A5J5EYN2_9PEZI|nr:hypothetical protein FN846DRAFT_889783 [Sphaerosporella brunnea]